MPNSNVDPALLQQYAQYFDPSAFSTPQGGGNQGGRSNPFPGIAGYTPVGAIANFFRKKDPTWNPYIDEQGNYVWNNPKQKNPVPVAQTPGAQLRPSHQYQTMANNVQAITDLLPAYSQAISGQAIPQAQAQLAAEQATSPGYNQLMTDMYKQFGPQLNAIGSQIAGQNQLAQVGNDTAAMTAANSSLIPEALKAQQQLDPEYYASRTLAANRLSDLLKSINLDGGLSGTENRQISQGLANEGQARGTAMTPSNLATVGNAMQYGAAGRQRVLENQSALSSALNNATSMMPSLKSGMDAFQIGSGRSSMPNAGASNFGGVQGSSAMSQAQSLGSGLMGNTAATQQNQAQLDLQNKLGSKDWADYLGQITSSVGGIAKIAGML